MGRASGGTATRYGCAMPLDAGTTDAVGAAPLVPFGAALVELVELLDVAPAPGATAAGGAAGSVGEAYFSSVFAAARTLAFALFTRTFPTVFFVLKKDVTG